MIMLKSKYCNICVDVYMYAIRKDMSRTNELRVKDAENVVKKRDNVYTAIVYLMCKDDVG